jgi:hypothetical protein
MDVHCSTCGEPWDIYHLWHDAIYDTDVSEEDASAWQRLPRVERLPSLYREKIRAAGWEFGASVINVIHCPGCPAGAKPDPEKVEIKAAIEELFGGDEDGLAATFED